MKDPKKVAAGKKSKAQGTAFELRVRADLESKGWIVDKWTNNVEFTIEKKPELVGVRNPKGKEDFNIKGKLVPAKAKWNNFTKSMMMGSGGFPDFCCFKSIYESTHPLYNMIGVESKLTGKLDRPEKDKCDWLLKNNIFSKILIAKKVIVKNRIVVEYVEYEN